MERNVSIDSEKCVRCGACVKECPSVVMHQEAAGEDVSVGNVGACIECGHCVMVCPTEAFVHSQFPYDCTVETDGDAVMAEPESLMNLMRYRRSNRSISGKAIPQKAMDDILEAARYAPTSENSRQVQLHVITDKDHLQQIEDKVMGLFKILMDILMFLPIRLILKSFLRELYARVPEMQRMQKHWREGGRPASLDATAIVLFTAPKNYMFGYQDCNLAYQNASLMAEAHKVSQIYLGFNQAAFGMLGLRTTAKLLRIAPNQKVYAIMALGMPSVKYHRAIKK